jgi:hypothetical protein
MSFRAESRNPVAKLTGKLAGCLASARHDNQLYDRSINWNDTTRPFSNVTVLYGTGMLGGM